MYNIKTLKKNKGEGHNPIVKLDKFKKLLKLKCLLIKIKNI